MDPFEADFLRQTFKDIVPGYHMSKQNWNTVLIDGDVQLEELYRQAEDSYEMVKPKLTNVK